MIHITQTHLVSELVKVSLDRLHFPNGEMFPKFLALRKQKKGTVFLYLLKGRIVAWALTWKGRRINHSWGETPRLNIDIYVHPKHRRKKIGTKLFRVAEQFYKKTPHGAYWSSIRAKRFYQSTNSLVVKRDITLAS